jgi:hypothetical protein
LRASLAVIAFLGTIGSFGVGFGTMTGCTNDHSCTATDCAPCATASGWLTAGWIGQGALLLAWVVLVAFAVRGVRLREVRTAALLLAVLSVALIAVTTVAAVHSY